MRSLPPLRSPRVQFPRSPGDRPGVAAEREIEELGSLTRAGIDLGDSEVSQVARGFPRSRGDRPRRGARPGRALVLDVFTDELPAGQARTVATSHLIFARTVQHLNDEALFEEFPELYGWCSDKSAAREPVGMRSIGSSSASKTDL